MASYIQLTSAEVEVLRAIPAPDRGTQLLIGKLAKLVPVMVGEADLSVLQEQLLLIGEWKDIGELAEAADELAYQLGRILRGVQLSYPADLAQRMKPRGAAAISSRKEHRIMRRRTAAVGGPVTKGLIEDCVLEILKEMQHPDSRVQLEDVAMDVTMDVFGQLSGDDLILVLDELLVTPEMLGEYYEHEAAPSSLVAAMITAAQDKTFGEILVQVKRELDTATPSSY